MSSGLIEVPLDHLAGAGDREIDCLAAKLRDRVRLLALDLLPGAHEHVGLLGVRLLHELGADALGGYACIGDELLRLAARRVERGTVFGEQASRVLTIALGGGDRFLERRLARPNRRGDRAEGEPAEDERENDEDDQRPRHQPIARREQVGLGRFFLRQRRRGEED